MFGKIILAALFLSGGYTAIASTDVQPSKMVSDFYRLPIREQIGEFKKHTLDEQYELYIFGNKIVHPPATYLADPFARQGKTAVTFLKAKLEIEREEARIRDIVLVFAEMARLKTYNFSQDAELTDLLDQKAGNMQGIWKEITLKLVSEIKGM